MVIRETCLACKGEGVVSVETYDCITGRCVTVHQTCKKCNGSGCILVPED